MDIAQQDRLQSEWDMAARWLARLDTYFYKADLACESGDAVGWFSSLCILRRELSTEMKPAESEESLNRQNQIKELIRTRKKTNGITRNISAQLYESLDQYEIMLRQILKKSGLQNKVSNDPRLAMG